MRRARAGENLLKVIMEELSARADKLPYFMNRAPHEGVGWKYEGSAEGLDICPGGGTVDTLA